MQNPALYHLSSFPPNLHPKLTMMKHPGFYFSLKSEETRAMLGFIPPPGINYYYFNLSIITPKTSPLISNSTSSALLWNYPEDDEEYNLYSCCGGIRYGHLYRNIEDLNEMTKEASSCYLCNHYFKLGKYAITDN